MQNVCVVFDIGKTNKKILAFNESFDVVYEIQSNLSEILDDEGELCEDLMALSKWLTDQYEILKAKGDFIIKALNFSGYGASFVHLDQNCQPLAPLYNYLKAFPKELKTKFFENYGPAEQFFKDTASPDLGMLNSGFQLYWLKYNKTNVFKNTRYSLHFPQYLSFVFSGIPQAEFTSIGCHTAIWDFTKNEYHNWLKNEHLVSGILPPVSTNQTINKENIAIGSGIHDSSSALVPYLKTIIESFVLISTGTWCISINPFNQEPLTPKELELDCLNFLSFEGKIVRASRLFSGNEHERQIKHLSTYFNVTEDYYKTVTFDYKIIQTLRKTLSQATPENTELGQLKDCPFVERNLNQFKSFEQAYHQFIMDLVAQQVASTKLVIGKSQTQKIFVDGGFSKNPIFMGLLAEAFHNIEVYASEVAQASALGAALVISETWTNKKFEISKLKLNRFY
jgi:sugar (pentulose or hexulose) kinase